MSALGQKRTLGNVAPMSALPPIADILAWGSRPFVSLGGTMPAGIRIGCELQILFDRVIADRYVNQCSTLKSRDELVVFDRIDGDATIAQAQHAVIFRAISGGGVPVWMQDPFKRQRMIDVTVVGGSALEHGNDHVSINRTVVPVDDGLVTAHDFGMRRLERT